MEFFIYDWVVFKNIIFAFGTTQDGQTVALQIPFKPYCFILLPDFVGYDDTSKIRQLQQIIRNVLTYRAPKEMTVVRRHRMFGTHLLPGTSERRKFTFLKCYFTNNWDVAELVKNIKVIGEQFYNTKLFVHDDAADAILQLVCNKNLPTCGWIKSPTLKYLKAPQTLCDLEYETEWQKLEKVDNILVPPLIIAAFDIECVGEKMKFPDPKMPNDVVFQISIVFSNLESCSEKHLLTLGKNVSVPDCTVHCFSSEAELIVGFSRFLQQRQVQFVLGYNIFKFDIPYLIERSKQLQCVDQFGTQGMLSGHVSRERKIKWSSSAYQDQEYLFLDAEGRVFVDLLPAIQKDYKLENYKLDTVSEHFLNEKKNDLSVAEIFDCYRQFTSESLAKCGAYCVKDSVLVVKLFNKLKLFYSLQGMANVCRVSIRTLLLRGQQIKVYSQIYQYCTLNQFTVEKPHYPLKENQRFTGAHVFDPQPGIYEFVVPFDFASLYPTTVIAYNIDYSTLVDESDTIDDSQCHVMEWKDHFDCDHANKVMNCTPRRFRFLREPKGILPQIIENLLNARRKTRSIMASETDALARVVLNQQQLAFKVSANSMYGITGVRQGMLPLMPLAMCITYMGRCNVLRAADVIQKDFGGQIVYGDTDSNYIIFPHIGIEQLYSFAEETSRLVSRQFPQPIYLEFENAVYRKFLIFKKKKYVYQSLRSDMTLDPKLGKTGVLLVRRDTFRYVRSCYEKVIQLLFSSQTSLDATLLLMTDQLIRILTRQVPLDDYVMTKSFNDFEGPVVDGRLGHYKVKDNDLAMALKQLPAMPQLVHRMRTRGDYAIQGNRIEYVVLNNNRSKQCDKVEHKDYYLQHQESCHIDYGYYLGMFIQPFDQILETVFKKKNVIKKFYNIYYIKHGQLMQEIRALNEPLIHFSS